MGFEPSDRASGERRRGERHSREVVLPPRDQERAAPERESKHSGESARFETAKSVEGEEKGKEERMVGLADMSSVSRENIEVMDALIGNFTLYDDVNKVYDILKGHRKLTLLCEEKNLGAKATIKQLQKQVDSLKEEKHELKAQNEELKVELSRAETEAQALEAKINHLQSQRDRLKATLVRVEEKAMNRKKTAIEHENRVKHELSLFAHISNLNWTVNDGDGTEIRGVISKTNKGDLNTFAFDTRKMSKYQIANKLWDAMDE